jgi:2-methylcitrate dehydratase
VTIVDLVANGMEGPDSPFEGAEGLFDFLGAFELPQLGSKERGYAIQHVDMKSWPACYRLQAPIFAARELHPQIDLGSLSRIAVYTHATAAKGSEPDKFDPRTRETADHSIPYVVARTLTNGGIGPEDFVEEAYLDGDLRPLMQKISVMEDAAIESAYPEDLMVKVVVEDKAGEHIVELKNPPGHWKSPLTDADVEEKFLRLTDSVLGPDRAVKLHEKLSEFLELSDLSEVFSLAVVRD